MVILLSSYFESRSTYYLPRQVSSQHSYGKFHYFNLEFLENQRYLKVRYCLITFWQSHSNDFRLLSVVDFRCYECDFCLFYTLAHVLFFVFIV